MTRWLFPALLGACLLLPTLGRAQEPLPNPTPVPAPPAPELPPPCAAPACQAEKTICLPRVTLVEEQAAVAVPKLKLREEVIARELVAKPELTWKEERHWVTEMKTVPRVCEQQVVVTELRPETSVDPHTGKPCTIYTPCPVVKTVKVTNYDVVPVQREVIVRLPCVRAVPKEVLVKRLVVDETTEAAICKRWHEVTIPNEIKVLLPACPLPCLP